MNAGAYQELSTGRRYLQNSYDVVFALETCIPLLRPPGGYNVVYQIASRLADDGFSVAIVVPSSLIAMYSSFDEVNEYRTYWRKRNYTIRGLLNRFFSNSFSRKIIAPAMRTLLGYDYDYSRLKKVRVMAVDYPRRLPTFSTKRIIATAWQTAYIVRDYINSRSDAKGYYLIQNEEDDAGFSGKYSSKASLTYEFGLHKIVIYEYLANRFKKDHPSLLFPAFDADFYRRIASIVRLRNRILIPFRAESKGGDFAVAIASWIMKNVDGVEVYGFGNMDPDAIPAGVRFFRRPPNEQLRTLYNQCAILIHPPTVGGLSLPAFEAMNCGCVVLAIDYYNVNEFIENGVNGFMVEQDNYPRLSDIVGELMVDDALREEVSRNAVAFAQRFSFDSLYEKFAKEIGFNKEARTH